MKKIIRTFSNIVMISRKKATEMSIRTYTHLQGNAAALKNDSLFLIVLSLVVCVLLIAIKELFRSK